MKNLIPYIKYSKTLFTLTKRLKAILLFNFKSPRQSLHKIIAIQKIISYSMMLPQDLMSLIEAIKFVNNHKIKGDIVECGVHKGGSAALMSWATSYFGVSRQLFLYDSFEGFPKPSREDKKGPGIKFFKGRDRANSNKVRQALSKLGNKNKVNIFQGWFSHKLFQKSPTVKKIALLHLDCDLYQSHLICLESFYHKVSPGGLIVFNDYGYLPGATKAIKKFFLNKNIKFTFPPESLQKPLIFSKE